MRIQQCHFYIYESLQFLKGWMGQILMERGKRGRPKNDYNGKQVEDQLGRRMRVSSKSQSSALRRRNYEIQNQDDSIDIEDIVYGSGQPRISFENWDQRVQKLHYQNYQTQDSSHQILSIKTQDPSLLENMQNAYKDIPSIKQQQIGIKDQEVKEPQYQSQQNNGDLKGQQQTQKPSSAQQQKQICRNKLQSFIIYLTTNKIALNQSTMHQLCQRFQLSKTQVVQIQKDYLIDPKLTKYINVGEDPLGPLINGKRQRTIERIKEIKELITENPYLTQKEICDKLAERNPGKKKILLSAVLRLMRLGGFKKKRIPTKINDKQKQKAEVLKKQFIASYRQLCENKASKVYYLSQQLFHRHLYCDSYWSIQDKPYAPVFSDSLIGESIIMIVFLTPQGNLLWQARQGNYKRQDYLKLITKMMKKYCKTQNDIVIVNESELRDIELAKEVGGKLGCTILKLPYKAQIINPLDMFFANMRQKVKKTSTQQSEDSITFLCQAVESIKKGELLELIEKSKHSILTS